MSYTRKKNPIMYRYHVDREILYRPLTELIWVLYFILYCYLVDILEQLSLMQIKC